MFLYTLPFFYQFDTLKIVETVIQQLLRVFPHIFGSTFVFDTHHYGNEFHIVFISCRCDQTIAGRSCKACLDTIDLIQIAFCDLS